MRRANPAARRLAERLGHLTGPLGRPEDLSGRLGRLALWGGAAAWGGLAGVVVLGVLLYYRDPAPGPFVLALLRFLHRPDSARLAVLLACISAGIVVLVVRAARGGPAGVTGTLAAGLAGMFAGAGFVFGFAAARRPPGVSLEAALSRAGWDLVLLVLPFAVAAAAAYQLWALVQERPPPPA